MTGRVKKMGNVVPPPFSLYLRGGMANLSETRDPDGARRDGPNETGPAPEDPGSPEQHPVKVGNFNRAQLPLPAELGLPTLGSRGAHGSLQAPAVWGSNSARFPRKRRLKLDRKWPYLGNGRAQEPGTVVMEGTLGEPPSTRSTSSDSAGPPRCARFYARDFWTKAALSRRGRVPASRPSGW